MTRGQRRRRLSFSWWQQLLLTLLPLVLVTWFFGKSEPLLPELAMPLHRCSSRCARSGLTNMA